MTTATVHMDIPLDLLVDCPLNTRTVDPDSASIRGLADSLLHRQLDAIKVRQVGARYEVIDGKRRHTAGRLAQLPTLRAELGEYTDNEARAIIIVSQRLLSIRLRPAALPPPEAIAELETLAALIPAEQSSKALREVPEPKRKG